MNLTPEKEALVLHGYMHHPKFKTDKVAVIAAVAQDLEIDPERVQKIIFKYLTNKRNNERS